METLKISCVGESSIKAQAMADEQNVPNRIVQVDGEQFFVTSDFVPERLNFYVERGKVVEVRNG